MRGWVVVCSILFLVGVALEVVTLTPLRQVSWVEQLHNLSFVPIWVSLVLLWVRAEGGREELFRLVRQAADAGETLKDRIREVGALKEEIERLKRAHEALRDELHLSELFLGKLHFFERDYRKSADLLKQAVEAQPDNAECRFWLGLALLRSGDARSAIEHLDRAAQLRDDPEFLKVLGEAEYQMRRWEDAIPHLEQALSKGVPNREETAILLAKAQARSGRRAEARVTLEELVRRNPYSANAISELVEMYLDDGDYARAVGICEEGLRANARNWSVYVRLAESLLLRNDPGDRERAQQALETVLLANPKDYHLYRVQGEDLVRRALNSKDDEQRAGLLAQAATVYEKGVNAVSGAYRGGLYNRLCYVRLALGQLENAEHAARQAVDAAPQHPNNYLALCAVLTGRKQWRALERTARKPRDLALGGRPTRILSLLYEVLGALCSGERLDEIGDQLTELVDAVRTSPDFRPIVPQWEFVRNSIPVDQIGGKERDVVSAIVSFMDGAIGRLTFVETLQEHLAPKP